MQDDEKVAQFVDAANEYGGIEYDCNCKIIVWKGDTAIVTLEDQDDREADQERVQLSYNGKTYLVRDLDSNLLATTNYPRVLFAILYA